jgi:hypothetical protein
MLSENKQKDKFRTTKACINILLSTLIFNKKTAWENNKILKKGIMSSDNAPKIEHVELAT